MSTSTTTTTKVIHTIKLVVIGASGVGKTSLRGQYISGRFTSGYRATIGTDFIAKTLPHPTKPEQNVTLQIWDTAGQERFSSLSTAFFRGADAVLLMFDIHQDESLDALHKWWAEFCEGLPLLEEDMLEYPCFVVGNKIDLVAEHDEDEGDSVEEYRGTRVSGDRIQRFLDELVPHDRDHRYSSDEDGEYQEDGVSLGSPPPSIFIHPGGTTTTTTTPATTPSPITQTQKSSSIDINPSSPPPPAVPVEDTKPKSLQTRPRLTRSGESTTTTTTSNNQFNTFSSLNSTTTSVYLTPSSSLFSSPVFHTAPSSPEASLSSAGSSMVIPSGSTSSPPQIQTQVVGTAVRQRRLTSLSSGSASSESAATITPSSFARREREEGSVAGNGTNNNDSSNGTTVVRVTNAITSKEFTPTTYTPPPDLSNSPPSTQTQLPQQPLPPQLSQQPPSKPERGPSLHFTSAKTGEGVQELFEHVAERVMRRWEYEEYIEARRMHYREASGTETIRLGGGGGIAAGGIGEGMEGRGGQKRRYERCCT